MQAILNSAHQKTITERIKKMNYLNINDRETFLLKQLSVFQPAIKECTKGRRKPLSFCATFIDLAQIKMISVRHH